MANYDDLKTELSESLEELLETTSGSKENLHQSSQTKAPRTLYLDRIINSFTAINNFMWPALPIWLGISNLVGVFSHHYANPGPIHYNSVILIFWYLARTLELGIPFESNSINNLVGYTTSDWARLKDSKKSIGAYIFFLSEESISH